MSESDDTDVLLLIPPDFFLVHSSESDNSVLDSSRTVVHKPQSCTAQVIGKLFTQVHSLESRLESLELSTSITDTSFGTLPRRKHLDSDSLDSQSVDRKSFTFPRRRRRKILKRERKQDLSLTSLDSLSTRKRVPSLKLNFEVTSVDSKPTEVNDTRSMDGDISSIVSTPSKKNDKLLLHEIDEFLTKVEAYESPEAKYKSHDTSLSSENVIKATGDYLSQKLDSKSSNTDEVRLPSGRMVPCNILDKYIYLVKSGNSSATQMDKPTPSTSTYKSQLNNEPIPNRVTESTKTADVTKTSQEAKSPGTRRLNFDNKDVQPTSTPKKPTSTYVDNFKPSSNKIYDRASKVLEQYKSQSYSRNTQNSMSDTSYLLAKEDFKLPQMRPYVSENKDFKSKLLDSIDTDLLSLSELWGEKGDKADRGDSNKLEEERLKREHCESMIQQLQKKLLEQQEKLAVALKVDRAKDNAITKLREAWVRLTGSLDRAEERHRAALEKMMIEVENFRAVADDAQKKTNHFEAELYKALDLAHDYQDKCKQLTIESKQHQESHQKVLLEKDDIIARKSKEIEVLQENYETVIRLNKQSTDCVKNLEDALEKERSDHEQTRAHVHSLNLKLQTIHDDTALERQERDTLRQKVNEERARGNILEQQLCEKQNQLSEMLRKVDDLESELKTLRKHLELQKNELKAHYQKQLEDAVLAKLQEFQKQLDAAEREMENDARGKENAIVDTFHKQISRIEEQHRLEVNVLEEKQREEIKLYRLQLAQAGEKIALLESKLESYRRRRGELAAQLHGVMEAQWRQALRILTSSAAHTHTHTHTPAHTPAHTNLDTSGPDCVSMSTPVAQDYAPPKIPPLAMPAFDQRRAGGRGRSAECERERRDNMFEALSDSELQQYVKLLLTKPPHLGGGGGAGGDSIDRSDRQPLEEPTSDKPERERRDKPRRSLGGSKPPWKA